MSAALCLLGDKAVLAAGEDTSTSASYRLSNYSESDLGASERYDISIQQFRITAPVNSNYRLSIDALYETMSGASPWYVIPDENAKPIQIMSGATIEENRQDIAVDLSTTISEYNSSISLGHSIENDYKATYGRIGTDKDFNNKHLNIFGGLAFSSDIITPTDADFYDRIPQATKVSRSLFAGFSQIITKKLLLASALSITRLKGYLSDPYKRAYTLDANANVQIVRDSRPNRKIQVAWSSKLRYHLGNEMSLHGEYRYFRDSWKISSHTLSSSLHKTIAVKWQVSQEIRYYNQSRAYFYAAFYNGTRDDGYHSSDYRLSPYGAISARFKLEYKHKNSRFNFAIEKYRSSSELALKSVKIDNPALVDFIVVTVGFDLKFD